jgi:hypothetical protein
VTQEKYGENVFFIVTDQRRYLSGGEVSRDRVLCLALQHVTGKSPDPNYPLKLVQEFLKGEMTADNMPVIRDVLPDKLTLGPAAAQIQAERQWLVQIGDYACDVGLFGVDDHGNPNLVVLGE